MRVDDYIGRAAAFARPILTEVREWVHPACPAVDEAAPDGGGAGNFSKLAKVSDLPSKKVFRDCVRKAMTLNEEGVAAPRRASSAGRSARAQ